MTKRIYKADNPQDVNELFEKLDMFYDDIDFIELINGAVVKINFKDDDMELVANSNLCFDIDFCGQSKITRPMEIKVGQFGKFWDSRPDVFIYGFLTRIARKYPYYVDCTEVMYEHFTPISADSDEGKKIIKAMRWE